MKNIFHAVCQLEPLCDPTDPLGCGDLGGGWWGPCNTVYVDGFEQPNPCYFVPIFFQRPTIPTITCDLQLFAQPISNNSMLWDHTYIGLTEQLNGILLPETYEEAGPISKATGQMAGSIFTPSWLNTLDQPPTGSWFTHAYPTTSTMVWQTGFSASECPLNGNVLTNSARYPQNSITYNFPAPNSNSFTYSLLNMSGVSVPLWVNLLLGTPGTGGLALPLAPGWGTLMHW